MRIIFIAVIASLAPSLCKANLMISASGTWNSYDYTSDLTVPGETFSLSIEMVSDGTVENTSGEVANFNYFLNGVRQNVESNFASVPQPMFGELIDIYVNNKFILMIGRAGAYWRRDDGQTVLLGGTYNVFFEVLDTTSRSPDFDGNLMSGVGVATVTITPEPSTLVMGLIGMLILPLAKKLRRGVWPWSRKAGHWQEGNPNQVGFSG